MAVTAAVAGAVLALPAAAHADQAVSRPFAADSGDSCRYGVTEGTLTWRFSSTPVPAPLPGVAVKGRLTDRPVPTSPSLCRDDGLLSVATFVAFAGTREIDRNAQRADNSVSSFDFVLGSSASVARTDRVVIQVCRHRASSVAPVYCGRAVEYRIPPVITP